MTQEFVTLPREVVERALDAFIRGCPPDCKDGMTDSGGVHPWGDSALIQCPACQAAEALRAALEQPQDDQEPAAEHELKDVRCECCGYMTHHREHMGCIRAAHTKCEPLTDEQIAEVLIDETNGRSTGIGFKTLRAFARAIEAAHNIK